MKADNQSADDFKGFNCFLPNDAAGDSPLPPSSDLWLKGSFSAGLWGMDLA